MNRWPRFGLALLSTIAAQITVGLVLSAFPLRERNLYWEHVFGFMWFSTFLVLPGFLIALPLILRSKPWIHSPLITASLGILIGPLVILILFAVTTGGTGANLEWVLKDSGLAASVSTLTTAFYLLSLHLAKRLRGPNGS